MQNKAGCANLFVLKEPCSRPFFGEKTGIVQGPSEFPDPAHALLGLGFGELGKPTGWANQYQASGAGVGKSCKTVQKLLL